MVSYQLHHLLDLRYLQAQIMLSFLLRWEQRKERLSTWRTFHNLSGRTSEDRRSLGKVHLVLYSLPVTTPQPNPHRQLLLRSCSAQLLTSNKLFWRKKGFYMVWGMIMLWSSQLCVVNQWYSWWNVNFDMKVFGSDGKVSSLSNPLTCLNEQDCQGIGETFLLKIVAAVASGLQLFTRWGGQ